MKKLLFAVLALIVFTMPLSNVEAGLITSWQSSGPYIYAGYADIWGYVSNSTDQCRWKPISLTGANSQNWKDLALNTSGGRKYIPAFKYYLSESAVFYLECKDSKTLWGDTNDKSNHLNIVQPTVDLIVNGVSNPQSTIEITQGDDITITWGASLNASACRWVQPIENTIAFSYYGLLNGLHLPQYGSQTFGPNDPEYPTSDSATQFEIECTEVNRSNLISTDYLTTFGKRSAYVRVGIKQEVPPPPPPPPQQSTRTLAVNGSSSSVSVDVGDTATASWSSSGVKECWSYRKLNGNSDFPNWDEGEYKTANTSASKEIGAFPAATTNPDGYTVGLKCPPDTANGFVLEDTENNHTLAKNWLAPILSFVKIAYAAVSADSAEVAVHINALQEAVLNVFAYMYPDVPGGPSGTQVTITGTQTGTSGTTVPPGYNYTDTVPAGVAINTTLIAPSAPSGKTFMGWNGCNAGYVSPDRNCPVTISLGGTKSASANYGPVPVQQLPDLVINSLIISPASPIAYGSTVTFTAVVKNNGTADVVNPSVTWGRIDYDNNGTWNHTLSDQNTGNLDIGDTETEIFTWVATRSGTHEVEICADEMNFVTESNEANNCSTSLREYIFSVGSDPGLPQQPYATLNVDSSPRGVSISRVLGPVDIAGTTYYSKSYENNISAELNTPAAAPDGSTFLSWTGCNSTNNRNCIVSVNVGDAPKTVTANYNVASSPNDAKLIVKSTGTPNVVITSTNGYGGITEYTKIVNGGNITDAYLIASLNSGGREFDAWYGCDSTPPHTPNICLISVTKGSSKIVTADYAVSQQQGWDYSLANSDPLMIDKKGTGVGQKVISRTVLYGTPDAISTISLSGIPNGVIASIANNPCTPTCSSTVTFTVGESAPNGASPITVTSQPGMKTLNFNLIITGNDMSVTCVPEPATALIGQPVTWTANVSKGTAPYTYVWQGSGIPTDPAPSVNPYTVTYSTIGKKFIKATVTDKNNTTASCSEESSVFINFDPQFEEF